MRRWWYVALALACLWFTPGEGAAQSSRPTDLWTPQTKTASVTSNQTDTVIWTPASGKRIALQGVVVSAGGAGRVEIESSDVDVVPPITLDSGGFKSFDAGGVVIWSGAVDATLAYTNTGGYEGTQPLSILVWGYEY